MGMVQELELENAKADLQQNRDTNVGVFHQLLSSLPDVPLKIEGVELHSNKIFGGVIPAIVDSHKILRGGIHDLLTDLHFAVGALLVALKFPDPLNCVLLAVDHFLV